MRSPPPLFIMDAPEAEKQAVHHLSNNLSSLGSYVESLRSAVVLFDFAHQFRQQQPTEEGRRIVKEWLFIAARDGAMMVYHFGKVWQVIPSLVKQSPSVDRVVRQEDLKAVGRAFETGFPGWAAVRKGVAHMGDFSKDRGNVADHATSGSVNLPGIEGAASSFYMSNSLFGRTYTATVDRKIVKYDLTTETVDKLDSIKNAIWDIFDKVDDALMAQMRAAARGNTEQPGKD